MSCTKELVQKIEGLGARLRVRHGELRIARANLLPPYLVEAVRFAQTDIVAFLNEREQRRLAEQARRDREDAEARRDAEMELLPGGERIAGPFGLKDL